MLDKEAGRVLKFNEYPEDIQKEIEKSWEAVFDLDRRDKEVGRTHKRNRSIQATLWLLKKEYVISIELLERIGDTIKPYNGNPPELYNSLSETDYKEQTTKE